MRKTIVFNNKSLADFGVFISGEGVFDAPERDEESISIPGRNGELTIDNGRYKNLPLKYPAFIATNLKTNAEALRNFLLTQSGYQRLEDDYHPQEFRMAKWTGGFNAEPVPELWAAKFDLTFSVSPQRFLKEGEQAIELSEAATITNGNHTTALPLIRAFGTGTLSIGGTRIQITNADEYTDIDCDLQEAYKDSLETNCNGNIILQDKAFPKLVPGDNEISFTGINKIEITPRWWIL